MAKTPKCRPEDHDYKYSHSDGNYDVYVCSICQAVDRRRVKW